MAVAKQFLNRVYPGHVHDAREYTDPLGQLLQSFYHLHNEPSERIHSIEMPEGGFCHSAEQTQQTLYHPIR